MPFQRNKHYLRDRTTETLGLLYAMHWPFRQPETARGVRQSILHDRLKAHGACFGETAGWERANWFAPAGVKAEYAYSYGRQNWFEHSAAEHLAVRNGVGLFDQSSFAKFVVQGPDAEAVLNHICANDITVPVGKLVYTQWLNERGGIEADLTITREAPDRFLVVTAAATQTRDFAWLQRHIPSEARAVAVDVGSSMAVLSVMGPQSRALLQGLTSADLSNAAFPFGTSQVIDLGYARVRASRITYVGELGWELYIPTECAPGVFDVLMEAGKAFDLTLCGYHALNSLRMEKGYRHWGHDISDEDSPLQAGLGFAVALHKPGGFIGQEALLQQKEQGLTRKLLQFALHDASKLLYHNEPVLRDGVIVGRISSGMFGHALGKSLGMGYVEFGSAPGAGDAAPVLQGNFEIEVAGVRVAATPSLAPFYDPKSLRIKG
jgi:4-methylaminobutanoate oxidase (formaldehyde-forming)